MFRSSINLYFITFRTRYLRIIVECWEAHKHTRIGSGAIKGIFESNHKVAELTIRIPIHSLAIFVRCPGSSLTVLQSHFRIATLPPAFGVRPIEKWNETWLDGKQVLHLH